MRKITVTEGRDKRVYVDVQDAKGIFIAHNVCGTWKDALELIASYDHVVLDVVNLQPYIDFITANDPVGQGV